MKEKRIDVLLSITSFLQLMFLGFAGSFAAELFKDRKNETILFMTSLFALILTIFYYLSLPGGFLAYPVRRK